MEKELRMLPSFRAHLPRRMTRIATLEVMIDQLKDPIFEPLFKPKKSTLVETKEPTT